WRERGGERERGRERGGEGRTAPPSSTALLLPSATTPTLPCRAPPRAAQLSPTPRLYHPLLPLPARHRFQSTSTTAEILSPRALLPSCLAPIHHTRAAPFLPFTTNARRHRSTVASAPPSAPLAPLLPPTRLLPLPLLLTRKERMGKENARTSASQS